MSPSLNDKALMSRFAEAVYGPLLDALPKEWMQDFSNIVLRFEPSPHVCTVSAVDEAFSISIDLDRMEKVTRDQLGEKEPKRDALITQFFGNLVHAIVRAVFNYNKDNHPRSVQDEDPLEFTVRFMHNLASREEKKLKASKRYIV